MNEQLFDRLLNQAFAGGDGLIKFAELIVQECITVLDRDDGATHHSELLLEHFGIDQ